MDWRLNTRGDTMDGTTATTAMVTGHRQPILQLVISMPTPLDISTSKEVYMEGAPEAHTVGSGSYGQVILGTRDSACRELGGLNVIPLGALAENGPDQATAGAALCADRADVEAQQQLVLRVW